MSSANITIWGSFVELGKLFEKEGKSLVQINKKRGPKAEPSKLLFEPAGIQNGKYLELVRFQHI